MAAAEARTVWQRTVNRYFVQEDAKRAPKLTSCHSSSSTKQLQDSASSPSVVHPHHQSSSSPFMPLHPTPNFHHHHHHFQLKKPLEAEVNNQSEFIEFMESRENFGSIGYDCDESSEKKLNELSFDSSSPWNPLSKEKARPWWRTVDKDELASLVAQRSLDYVENCDLPTPQKMNRSYHSSPRCFDSDVFQDYSVSSQTIHEHVPISRGSSEKNRTEVLCESDLSKSELLEAMRHFQTRAREAEKMAKEAYVEKENLVKLLFKQASELFGHKQWLKLLQLQTLYLQIKKKKNKNIPWSNIKARKQPVRNKRAKPNKAKYVVSLALEMSLVCAGLLLGWTVGWMQILSF